jgi:amidohydrolase
MIDDLGREIDALAGQLVQWRRDFHRHPEVAFEERRTSGVVRAFLEDCGIEVRACAGTGLRGVLTGAGQGPTVALRADMDALPVTEENDSEYRSQEAGVMHACGHDGHMAILMGTAKLLCRRRATLPGHVVFLFQPAEEDPPGGARRMIEEGALDGVDRIFGLHLWQPLATGVVGLRSGAMMAQADKFKVVVSGRGGHASQPHLTVDPVLAASHVIVAAQSIASRFVDPLAPFVLSFTTVHGGRAHNIIPDSVTLTGTVRAFDLDVQRAVKERLRQVCEQTCQALGAVARFEYEDGYPPVVNDDSVVDLVRRVARRELGEASVTTIEPVMGGEDFAYFLQRVPGAFAMLGAGDGMAHPHHSARFDIDERVLPLGVRLMTGVALEALGAR